MTTPQVKSWKRKKPATGSDTTSVIEHPSEPVDRAAWKYHDRTTDDLIAELDAETPNFTRVMLVVAFEKENIWIFGHDENRLQELNLAVSKGGHPVGIVGVTINDDGTVFERRVLKEYAGQGWANDFLIRVIDDMIKSWQSGL